MKRALSALLVAAPVVASTGARADVAVEVSIDRDAPFKEWCVAPACQGDVPRRAQLAKLPAFIAPSSFEGLFEQRAKRAVTDALESAAKALLGSAYDLAVADLGAAVAATAASDRARLEGLGGLGAAAVRAALAYHLDGIVAADPRCTGARRADAIYEGLGASVALAPLDFSKKRGHVDAPCADTAKRTASAVDQAILRAVVPEPLRAKLDATVAAIETAKKSCADLPSAAAQTAARVKEAADVTSATTVDGAARALRAFAKTAPPQAPAPSLDPNAPENAPPSAAEQACTAALDALRAVPPEPLDALAREGLSTAALGPLAASLRTAPPEALAIVVRVGTGAMSGEDLRALVTTLVTTLMKSAGLPIDAPILKDVVEVLPKAITTEGGAPTLDPNVILTFLANRYGVDDDGRPSLKTLLGLQATPFVFELNGGLPQVDFSQQKYVGDATVGYATKKFGIVGRGFGNNYAFNDAQTHSDYLHTGGSLEAWWLSGDGTGKLRLELRLAGAYDYYDTTTYPLKDALSHYYDFDANIARGTLFAGIRYGSAVDRANFQLLLGGGGQFESPDTFAFANHGTKGTLDSNTNWTAHASARLLARVHVVPQVFGIRLWGDATYFTITREQLAVALLSSGGIGTTTTTSTVEQQQQIEVRGRLFLDAEVASLAGFVPAVFGGIDYIGISGSATSSSNAIPLLGIGIVRNSW